jgi:hypothetical protein
VFRLYYWTDSLQRNRLSAISRRWLELCADSTLAPRYSQTADKLIADPTFDYCLSQGLWVIGWGAQLGRHSILISVGRLTGRRYHKLQEVLAAGVE